MKTQILFFVLFCTFSSACTSGRQSTEELITVDVSSEYPQKDIQLSDIADIEYIQLDTSDDTYLFKGEPSAYTANTIVVYDQLSGNILFFAKDGTPKSHFNHKGNGPGEYPGLSRLVYDEKADELFGWFRNKILVYSSTGEYKRTLTLPEDAAMTELVVVDKQSLILYDDSPRRNMGVRILEQATGGVQNISQSSTSECSHFDSPFVRISRIDGSVLEYIRIPQNQEVLLGSYFSKGEMSGVAIGRTNRIVPYHDGWVLFNQETDTAFFYNKEGKLTPFFVRTPPIAAMSTYAYPNLLIEAGGYQFIETVTIVPNTPRKFPSANLARDRKTGEVYQPKIILDEFAGTDITLTPMSILASQNAKTGVKKFSYEELMKAFEDGKLSGRLKEIVTSFNEDDESDIYMLMHFK